MSLSTPSILSKAKQIGAAATLAVAAATSAHADLTLDYSAAGNYSNSGWFTGVLQDSEADGIIIDDGFKLWGESTRTDGIFWRYDDIYDMTVPGSDTTGIAMVWGGKITGATSSDDVLTAPYDFSMFFTHLDAAFHYTQVQGSLTLGFSEYAHTPAQWQSGPKSNYYNSDSEYFSYYAPGTYNELGDLSVNLIETDADTDLYWFVQLEMHIDHEHVSPRNWSSGNYSKLDGDTFTLTVPQNSIDVTFIPTLGGPTTPPVLTPVPEPGTIFSGIALALGVGIAAYRRRRRA